MLDLMIGLGPEDCIIELMLSKLEQYSDRISQKEQVDIVRCLKKIGSGR
jgi:hypothetical protein